MLLEVRRADAVLTRPRPPPPAARSRVDCAIPLNASGRCPGHHHRPAPRRRPPLVLHRRARSRSCSTPGPALVEPSVTNPSDPNIDLAWDFCEFTYNHAQLFANLTFVDFVCIPLALTLTDTSGAQQTAAGPRPPAASTPSAPA